MEAVNPYKVVCSSCFLQGRMKLSQLSDCNYLYCVTGTLHDDANISISSLERVLAFIVMITTIVEGCAMRTYTSSC